MRKFVYIISYFILSIVITVAQSTVCPANYSLALSQTQEACDNTARNQACYGNNTINLVPFVSSTQVDFDTPGDVTDVDAIRSLSLSALDETTGDWGIAMLRLLANLDPSQTQDITMLLFGDVEIESSIDYTNTVPVTTSTFANIRRYPNTSASVVTSIAQNKPINAVGRLDDNSWVQIVDEETNIGGWVFVDLLYDFDIESLDIVAPSQPYFGPMQAFYYRSGNGETGCTSIPSDGLLIQTPEGVGRVTVWINEVTIDFISGTGSTAYVQAPAGDNMLIDMVEGDAFVVTESGGYVAVEGSTISVEPASNSQPPKVNPPQPSNEWTDGETPVVLFERKVETIQPASVDEIAQSNGLSTVQYAEVVTYGYVVTTNEPNNSESSSTSDNNEPQSSNGNGGNNNAGGTVNSDSNANSSNGNNENCPGNSCNAPGQNNNNGNNENCPGNSCNAPGQNNGNNGNGNSNGGNNGNGNSNGGNNGNGNGNSGNNGNGNGNGGNNGNGNSNGGNNGNGNGKKNK